MNTHAISLLILVSFALGASAVAAPGDKPQRLVFLVAGQSNVLNWHADAAMLPPSSRDASVPFFYLTGAPPSRSKTPFNSSSGGKWDALAPQVQNPFVKYQERFFGPEITAARTILESGTANIAVVKVAFFGSNLAVQWNPAATEGDRLYGIMHRELSAALELLRDQGEEPVLAGIFWMQGEADAKESSQAQAYATNLASFVARVRQDFQAPIAPFILGRIGPDAKNPNQDVVRQAQVKVAGEVPRMAWVDTDDLDRDTDGVHLMAPGVITLGERLAKAWIVVK